jgi:hypothetical protein
VDWLSKRRYRHKIWKNIAGSVSAKSNLQAGHRLHSIGLFKRLL